MGRARGCEKDGIRWRSEGIGQALRWQDGYIRRLQCISSPHPPEVEREYHPLQQGTTKEGGVKLELKYVEDLSISDMYVERHA